jgi:excinuclease ABC subunit C
MEEKIFIESPHLIPRKEQFIKKFLLNLPVSPGVYKFLDKHKKPLYIGKAKLLKKRVSSYFRVSSRTKKIDKLIEEAKFLEFALTTTELESLLLEQFLIKEYKPKFNVQFKDDKGYPWIKIENQNDYPSAKSFLGKKQQNGKFFGPFPNPYAVRDALKLVQKTFKLRNCSDSYFKNRSRPCLQYEIGRCSAPCIGLIENNEYLNDVKGAELLLSGKSEELIDNFYSLMDEYSLNRNYEKAAMYRDRISALRDIQRSQSIAGFLKSRDALYTTSVKGIVKIGVTHVHKGWVVGHQNYLQDNDSVDHDILEEFISQQYFSTSECPSVLVVNQTLKNKGLIEKALSSFHSKKIVIITRPGKKDKGLLDVCRANTEYTLRKNKEDKNILSKITELRKQLNIVDDINLIESYDISHHAGDNAVAGCVVFTKEGKAKKLYRKYNISKSNAGNDIASMVELIERRFSKDKERKNPDLIIIDGGKTHLKSVLQKFKDLKLDKMNIISISKGIRRKASFDSIHIANGTTLSVKEGSIFINFIQEIRDETHRFAIESQKKRRSKKSISSSINSLYGIGPVRKRLLLRHFGSVEQIKRASLQDILRAPGIGKVSAQEIFSHLK